MRSVEMKDLLVGRLVRAVGGSRQHWRRAIGEIVLYSRDTHAHCNWDVRASGSAQDVEAVNAAVDAVRMENPYLSG